MQQQIFKCDFCQIETDGKLILRDLIIEKKDGSDLILCSECLNLYANHEYYKLEKRMIIGGKIR